MRHGDGRTAGLRETLVGKPVLAITKTGPGEYGPGDATYTITVTKTLGTALAREVVVTDTVPEGLSHTSGQRELLIRVAISPTSQSPSRSPCAPIDVAGCATPAVSSNAGRVNAEAYNDWHSPG